MEPRTDKISKRPLVVKITDPKVTHWDGDSYPYVDSIDQNAVDHMLQRALGVLTGKSTYQSAWKEAFPYRKGEKIAIKPNFNDLYADFRGYVTTPQVINAILKGLIETLGVPSNDIIVYDVSRIIPNTYRKRILYDIQFVEPYGSSLWRKMNYHLIGNSLATRDPNAQIAMQRKVNNPTGEEIHCFLPKCLTSCDHLINVPIFKSHQFVLASGALKNHYGTVRFSDGHLTPEYLHPPIIHESIADLNAHPVIRSRTRLIIMDALLGRVRKKGGPPDLRMNSLFLSQDPVAIDSVTSSLISQKLLENGEFPLSNQYLELAAQAGLGIYERPGDETTFKHIDFRKLAL